jgi:hypothetical protein
MKIKILKTFWSTVGNFNEGDEPELPEETARHLIAAGLAKPEIKPEKRKKGARL